MKIRTGFVSNSSSSSFVVFFSKKPETAEEMKKLLYGDLKRKATYDWMGDDDVFDTIELATAVFNDLKNKKPATYDEIVNNVISGWNDDFRNFYKREENNQKEKEQNIIEQASKQGKNAYRDEPFCSQLKDSKREHYDKKREDELEFTKKQVSGLFSSLKDGENIYTFHYSDNDGDLQCELEHGETFKNLKHICISYH